MAQFRFMREARTPHSESYRVADGEHAIARADIHLTGAAAHATLVIHQSVAEDTLHELLEALDDEIVSTADPYREDLVVTVWRGEEVGVFADNEDEGEDGDADGEDDEDAAGSA